MQARSLSDRLSQAGAEREALNTELDKVREELLTTKRALEETAATDTMLKIQLEGSAEEKTHLQVGCVVLNRRAFSDMVQVNDAFWSYVCSMWKVFLKDMKHIYFYHHFDILFTKHRVGLHLYSRPFQQRPTLLLLS